jgi:phage repressor protein C with HTH and peptisase S24 domain
MKANSSRGMLAPMSNLASRIKLIRKQAKLSQERFAEALGTVDGVKVTRGAVGNWELGGGISRANIVAISEKFGAPLDWLEFGRGEVSQKSTFSDNGMLTTRPRYYRTSENLEQNARLGEPVRGFAQIPVRGQGMGDKDGCLIFTNQNLGEVVAPPVLAGVPDAYAVYVVGDSMLERYQHGEVVYVHPYLPVRKNDDCVVQISAGDGETPHGFIKRFVSMDDKTLRVMQLNPRKILTFPRHKVIHVHRIVMSGRP